MVQASDERNRPAAYQWNATSALAAASRFMPGVLWPGSRFMGGGGGMGGPFQDDFDGTRACWGVELRASGGQQHKVITGTTRDSASTALPNCVVAAYLTTTDVLQGEATSDNGGTFSVPTRETGAHYLVAYKAGSPDVMGTTVNTLIPT